MASPSSTFQAQYGFFHGNSKFLNKEAYTNTYSSQYKHCHVTNLQDIIAETLPYCTTQTAVDAWMVDNPGILKKYTKQPLTPLALANNEIYYIKDTDFGGRWMKPIVLPELIPHTTTNLRATGYQPSLYKEDGSAINNTDGCWFFDPYQGAVKFINGYQPTQSTLSWGIPKITCYVFIGKTLDIYLNEIKPITFKYTSQTPLTTHLITHNLNTMDLLISTRVQDPINPLKYTNDSVGLEYLDSNNIKVYLTEALNISACLQVAK